MLYLPCIVYRNCIKENTRAVLLLQICDGTIENGNEPFKTNNLVDFMLTPATMLQHNWFKLQEYFQNDKYNYFLQLYDRTITQLNFIYLSQKTIKWLHSTFILAAARKKMYCFCSMTPSTIQQLKILTDKLKY